MSRIFISHSSQDNAEAEQLKQQLESWDYSVFLDFDPETGIQAGTDWEKILYYNLQACQSVIVLCSSASMASKWVFAEITHARSAGKHLFPVKIENCEPFPILTPTHFFDPSAKVDPAKGLDYEGLRRGLKHAGLEDVLIWDGKRAPYPGLIAFDEADAALFFGRADDISTGLERLRSLRHRGGERLLLYLGASGSGKSSLVRAGLVPRLRKDLEHWIVVTPFKPINEGLGDPFENLATVLSEAFEGCGKPREVAEIREQLMTAQEPHSLLRVTRDLAIATNQRKGTVLIVIDQFEELLGNVESNQAKPFLDWLRDAIIAGELLPTCPFLILATMRSDFVPDFQQSVLQSVKTVQELISPIAVRNFGELVEGPAQKVGLKLQAGLVTMIVEDANHPNALPLLAFTLSQLYQQYGNDGELEVEEYKRLGGLKGAVAKTAQTILDGYVAPKDQKRKGIEASLRSAFMKLVRLDEQGNRARRMTFWKDLPTSIHELLEQFVEGGLLVSSGDKESRMLEVSHEALLSSWPLLDQWIIESKKLLLQRQKIEARAEGWQNDQKRPDHLLKGKGLREVERFIKQDGQDFPLNKLGNEFFKASIKQRYRFRRKLAGILSVFCLGGLVWGGRQIWLCCTPDGQMYQVRQELVNPLKRNRELVDEASVALVKAGRWEEAFRLVNEYMIDNPKQFSEFVEKISEFSSNLGTQALEVLTQSVSSAEMLEDSDSKSMALIAIADAYSNLQDATAAKAVLTKAVSVAETLDSSSKSNALIAIAEAAGNLKDTATAKAILTQAISAAKTLDSHSKSRILIEIAEATGNMKDTATAKAILTQAISAAEMFKDSDNSKSMTLSAIAKAYTNLQDAAAAKAVLKKAVSTAKMLDSDSKFRPLIEITEAAGNLNDTEAAKATLTQTFSATKMLDSDSKLPLLIKIAEAYSNLKDVTTANAVLTQAFSAAETIDSDLTSSELSEIAELANLKDSVAVKGYLKSFALHDIVEAAGKLRDSAASIDILTQAISAAETLDSNSKSNALSAIAAAAGNMKDTAAAKAILIQTVSGTETLDSDSKSNALSAIAKAYCNLQDAAAAKAIFTQAISAAKTLKDSDSSKSITLRTIAEAASNLKDTAAAKGMLTQAISAAKILKDSDSSKSFALSAIAEAAGNLNDTVAAKVILTQTFSAAETLDSDLKSVVLDKIVEAAGNLQDATAAKAILTKAISAAETLKDSDDSKSIALSTIAKAYSNLQDIAAAKAVLTKAVSVVETLDSRSKSNALIAIAKAAGNMKDTAAAKAILTQTFSTAETLDSDSKSLALSEISEAYGKHEQWGDALRCAQKIPADQEYRKINVLIQVITFWAEKHNPKLVKENFEYL